MNQQKGGGNQEVDYGMIYLVVLIIGIVMALYYFFHDDIVKIIFYFKYYEIKLINFFVPAKHFSYLINWMDNIMDNNLVSKVTFEDVKSLSATVGESILWTFVIVAAIFTGILYYFHPDSNYKTIETMDSLRRKLKHFPVHTNF